MRVQLASLKLYENVLTTGQKRRGAVLQLISNGAQGFGDMTPLMGWSHETLEEAIVQFNDKIKEIESIEWTQSNFLKNIQYLKLYPSLSFALESAVSSIIAPLSEFKILTSALLMGSLDEILKHSVMRLSEGFTSAKLKVSQLNFEDARIAICALKDKFRLRIDVNRSWTTSESLKFFSQFPQETFDYVEEPFQNPKDLLHFTHPLAVDESFPKDLSFQDLECLPTLKALIYKPTLQGGMSECLPYLHWSRKRNLCFVLSSSFESDIGLMNIASMAHRLNLKDPIGIGTYHYLQNPRFQMVNGYFETSTA